MNNINYTQIYNAIKILKAQKQYNEVKKLYQYLLQLSNFPNELIKEYLIFCTINLQDYKNVIKFYKQYKHLITNIEIIFLIAYVYKELGYFKKAKKLFHYGFSNKNIPKHLYNNALFLKATYYLSKGNYKKGFKYFSYRPQVSYNYPKLNNIKKNISLKKKHILIFQSQGYGDNIQFIRYLPIIKEKYYYAIITLAVDNNLYKLFKKNQLTLKFDNIILLQTINNYTFDYEISIFDLASLVNIKKTYIKYPYLNIKQKNKLQQSSKPAIAFSYQGNKNHQDDSRRSIKIDTFKYLFNLNANFYYIGNDSDTINELTQFSNIKIIKSNNFYQTAQIIQEMDFIITVDTSLAHLSGALNKKTYLLLHKYPDWRWQPYKKHSIWYNNITLVKQKTTWDKTITKLYKILKKKL